MADLVWTETAAADFEVIYKYLMRSGRGAAEQFVESINNAVEQLRAFPRSGRVIPEIERDDFRQLLVLNYRLIYRLFGDDVEIETIYHGARRLDPSSFA